MRIRIRVSRRGSMQRNELNVENGDSVNVASANMPSSSLENGDTRKPKRKRYTVLSVDESKRLVEDTSAKMKEGETAQCPICFEDADTQLIHLEERNGTKKENSCTYRFCFQCVQKSIAAQESQSDLIKPRCPCCRGLVGKAVKLKTTKSGKKQLLRVVDLPSFIKQGTGNIMENADDERLVFAYNEENDVVTSWKILAPTHRLTDVPGEYDHTISEWTTVLNTVMLRIIFGGLRGLPPPSELQRAVVETLTEHNVLDKSWLPAVYDGTQKKLQNVPLRI